MNRRTVILGIGIVWPLVKWLVKKTWKKGLRHMQPPKEVALPKIEIIGWSPAVSVTMVNELPS